MPLCYVCSNIKFQPIENARPKDPPARKKRHAISASDILLLTPSQLWRHWISTGKVFPRGDEDRCLVAFLHPCFDTLQSSVIESRRTGRTCGFCETVYEILLQTETRRKLNAQRRKIPRSKFDFIQWRDRLNLKLIFEEYDRIPLTYEYPNLFKRTELNKSMRNSQAIWLRYNGHDRFELPLPTYISVGMQGMQERKALLLLSTNSPVELPIPEQEEPSLSEDFNLSLLQDENTNSLSTIFLAHHWLKECVNNHPACGMLEKDYRPPTRVLDLEPDNEYAHITLVDGSSCTNAFYATLSHRWGTYPPLQTNTKNESSHRDRIPISTLPQTFQDAMKFTRKLGLRYLWIDSLCIIQDSETDKTEELPAMGSYFYNAVFNLSAHSAADSRTGLHFSRNGAALRPQSLSCELNNDPTKRRSWTVVPLIDSNRDMRSTKSILSERGWIFQEHVFSRRIFHFKRNSIAFSCYTLFASEVLPRGINPNISLEDLWALGEASNDLSMLTKIQRLSQLIQTVKIRELGKNDSNSPAIPDNHLSIWYSAIELYSKRKLTYETDRLPAISGLAKIFSEYISHEYVAGLWKGDLLKGLCWKGYSPSARKVEYIAPSWSWASKCPNQINFIDGFQTTYGPMIDIAKILGVQISPVTQNPYGEVNEANLSIFGRLIATTIRVHDRENKRLLVFNPPPGLTMLPPFKKVGIDWDFAAETPPKQGSAYLLPLQRCSKETITSWERPEDSFYYSYCLVLLKTHNGAFQREGIARVLWTRAALERIEEQQIYII